jgi:hypothetical protein
MRIAIAWDMIFITSKNIIMLAVYDKDRHSPDAAIVTHGVSFADENTSWDPADQSDFAPEQESRAASGVVNPVDNTTKETHRLRNDVTCLEIQRKCEQHHPTGTSERTVPKVQAPIMLHNIDFPNLIQLHWAMTDHDLPL